MEKTQVFVRIDDFKDINEIMMLAKQRLTQAKQLLARLADLKAQEDAAIESWNKEMLEVEQRIEGAEHTLTGRER